MNKKPLGIWMLTALVVGNMIGSGIFLLPASLASFGAWGLFGWILTALGAMMLAGVFARLSMFSPMHGGPYAYCRDGLGDFVGFLVSYSYWIAICMGNTAVAVAFVSYATTFLPILAGREYGVFASIVLVWLLTIVNLRGVREAGILVMVSTILKLFPIILIVGAGLAHYDSLVLPSMPTTFEPQLLLGAAALTLWAFIGIESATIPANSAINPEKNIPRATMIGTLLTAVIYIVSTVIIIGLIPIDQMQESNAPYADAARMLFGPVGMYLVAFGACFSCLGSLNGWILIQAQMPKAAAEDGLFPKCFKSMSRYDTPYVGLVLSVIMMTLLLLLRVQENLVDTFTYIISMAVFSTLIPYVLTSISALRLFRRYYRDEDRKKLLWSSTLAILSLIYSIWAMVGSGWQVIIDGLILSVAGVPLYIWAKKS